MALNQRKILYRWKDPVDPTGPDWTISDIGQGCDVHLTLHYDGQFSECITAPMAVAIRQLIKGLNLCWGQKEDGGLRFVVNVTGLGASPKSPALIAEELTRAWTYAQPMTPVVVDSESRQYLGRSDQDHVGRKQETDQTQG